MKRYNVFYFIGQAFTNLWRNGLMTFVSIAVLMSLLVVIGGFSLLVVNININMKKFGTMNEIVVFVDREASEEKIEEIENTIKALDNIEKDENGTVTGVVRVTKAEGLQQLKQENPGVYDDITDENNPLPDKFIITYSETAKVPELDYQLRQIEGLIKVNNRLDLATGIENLKNGIMLIFVWFLIILFVVSLFIIVNTIKLSVFARKDEISIMRYVGATRTFISLPFIFEGVIIGVVSSVIAYFVEWFLYAYIERMVVSDYLQMIDVLTFDDVSKYVLFGFLAIGILTGVVGSSISLGKYSNK